MADIADVENGLASIVAAAVYPSGTGAASIAGVGVKIYRGWPVARNLDVDLKAGLAHVTIFPPRGLERITSRGLGDWKVLARTPATITATVAGNTVTLGGAIASPQYITLVFANRAFSYAVQPGDTLASAATGLAVLVNASVPASSIGPVITIATSAAITARVASPGTIMRELRRTERSVMVTAWCGTPALRDTLAGKIDAALAGVRFLSLPDGSGARLIYTRTNVNDEAQEALVYRRDLYFTADYAVTETDAAYPVTSITLNIQPDNATTSTFTS
jgi:predicted outer membrane repeat protein